MIPFTLSENLFQQASDAAQSQGLTVDEFVAQTLSNALAKQPLETQVRNGIPIFKVGSSVPTIDLVEVGKALHEEGV